MSTASGPAEVMYPRRIEYRTSVRPVAALAAGAGAGAALLLFYYATLALLPAIFAYPATVFPCAAWAHRLDISQFIGTMAFPPTPSPFTWVAGLCLWLGVLVSCGLVYAILLAWALQYSDALKGVGFAIALAVTLVAMLSIAQGYQTAIMRNALPDVGVLMVGWSFWAPVQLGAAFVLYGALLGTFYRRFSRM